MTVWNLWAKCEPGPTRPGHRLFFPLWVSGGWAFRPIKWPRTELKFGAVAMAGGKKKKKKTLSPVHQWVVLQSKSRLSCCFSLRNLEHLNKDIFLCFACLVERGRAYRELQTGFTKLWSELTVVFNSSFTQQNKSFLQRHISTPHLQSQLHSASWNSLSFLLKMTFSQLHLSSSFICAGKQWRSGSTWTLIPEEPFLLGYTLACPHSFSPLFTEAGCFSPLQQNAGDCFIDPCSGSVNVEVWLPL